MKMENIRTIGLVLICVTLAVLVICYDDIKAFISGSTVEQADSLMDQLLR